MPEKYTTGETIIKLILVLGLLLAIGSGVLFRGQAPRGPAFYYPDPTPIIVETQRIEILSNNRLCVGSFESC